MARSKKKPNYNSVKEDQDFLKRVSDYYQEIVDGRRYSDKNKSEDEAAFKYVIQTAEEFNVTPHEDVETFDYGRGLFHSNQRNSS